MPRTFDFINWNGPSFAEWISYPVVRSVSPSINNHLVNLKYGWLKNYVTNYSEVAEEPSGLKQVSRAQPFPGLFKWWKPGWGYDIYLSAPWSSSLLSKPTIQERLKFYFVLILQEAAPLNRASSSTEIGA